MGKSSSFCQIHNEYEDHSFLHDKFITHTDYNSRCGQNVQVRLFVCLSGA